MDPARIAVRAIAVFAYLLYSTRVSGKKLVAQATAFDFVVALIVGDLVDDALWAEVPMVKFATAATTIFLCDAIVNLLTYRFPFAHRIFCGRPRVFIRDGREQPSELRPEQVNELELQMLERMRGVTRRADIRAGTLELDGRLSLQKNADAEPAQKSDLGKLQERRR